MSAARQRRFLILQGPLSPLYARIAACLRAAGHSVHRINLSVGDCLHWRGRGAESYRGRPRDWPAHVARRLDVLAITDIVLHADKRPYHAAALTAAAARGIDAHVTELGLLRSGFMTLLQGRAGALPMLPSEPDAIRRLAARHAAPDLNTSYPQSFWRVAAPDVIYNLSQTLLWPLYPHYQRHTIYWPPHEYAAWIGRLLSERRRAETATRLRAAMTHTRHVVVPLQLDGDFQIRTTRFRSQAPAIAEIVASFAAHAPADMRLVFKSHPLDNGLERWGSVIAAAAARHDVAPRVHIADGGPLAPWIAQAEGVVTINSTAGLEALMAGTPVCALAPVVYAMPGLTHAGPLDTFWTTPQRPDAGLVADLVTVLAATTQVRGSLYDARGLDDATANIAARLLAYPTPVDATGAGSSASFSTSSSGVSPSVSTMR